MKSKQLLVASGIFVLVAFVLGVAFGLPSSSGGIEAQEIEPVPTADVSGWTTPTADDPMANLTAEQVLGDPISDSGGASGDSDTTEPTYYDPNLNKHCVRTTGRCITMPNDVVLDRVIIGVYCVTTECAQIPKPLYLYERGTSQIIIDNAGNLHTAGLDNPDPSAFPFFEGANR